MKMTPVESGAIHSCGYDPETGTLRVKFHSGGTYEYSGVSQRKYDEFLAASSKGQHFHRHIKPHHGGSKVS